MQGEGKTTGLISNQGRNKSLAEVLAFDQCLESWSQASLTRFHSAIILCPDNLLSDNRLQRVAKNGKILSKYSAFVHMLKSILNVLRLYTNAWHQVELSVTRNVLS